MRKLIAPVSQIVLMLALSSCTNTMKLPVNFVSGGGTDTAANRNIVKFSMNTPEEFREKFTAYLSAFKEAVRSGSKNYPQIEGDLKLSSPGVNVASNIQLTTGSSFVQDKVPTDVNAVAIAIGEYCEFACIQFGILGICNNCYTDTGCDVQPGQWSCPTDYNNCDPALCEAARQNGGFLEF